MKHSTSIASNQFTHTHTFTLQNKVHKVKKEAYHLLFHLYFSKHNDCSIALLHHHFWPPLFIQQQYCRHLNGKASMRIYLVFHSIPPSTTSALGMTMAYV